MSQKVRKGEELDEGNLKSFLKAAELIEDEASELDITQFSTGFSNLTYLLQIEGKKYVLRRPPFGAVKRGHDMGREYKVLSNLKTAFGKIPAAFAFSEDETIIGAPFYLMEMMEGVILSTKEAFGRKIAPEGYRKIAHHWMDTFVALHKVDYQAAGLGELGKPEGYVERQVTNWGKQYLAAATMEIPEAKSVMKWMEENQPKQYDFRLIHNDYKYDNVVFRDDSWEELIAVLDWEMCTIGDPLMDLGTSVAYWFMSSDHEMIIKGWPSPTVLPGNPGREELLSQYEKRSGRTVNHPVFYYVYGLFKIAVIVQQIYYRYSKGLTTDERFANLDQAAALFCKMAWAAIQKNRIERLFE